MGRSALRPRLDVAQADGMRAASTKPVVDAGLAMIEAARGGLIDVAAPLAGGRTARGAAGRAGDAWPEVPR
jgi:hypothetical protein